MRYKTLIFLGKGIVIKQSCLHIIVCIARLVDNPDI